jgi:hypothetical protein
MAPLPFDPSTISDLDISSLELDRRSTSTPAIDLATYLSSLTFSEREALSSPPSHSLVKRSPISPMEDYSLLRARDVPQKHHSDPGRGTIDPNHINMKGFFVLFGFIGAAMVVLAIWFFFWAKNGGFHWQKGDWDDYKSTVLRRKGPDGKTLSGATKSTALGGGSVVNAGYRDDDATSQTMSEMVKINVKGKGKAKGGRSNNVGQNKQERLDAQREEKWEGGADDDVRAYRHEKPARVGGLNRPSDGFYNDGSTDPSEYTQSQGRRSRHHSPNKHHADHREPSGYSFTAGSEDLYTHSADERRPARYQNRASHQPTSRQSSPKKPRTSMPGSFADPIDFSTEYLGSGSESQGTRSYYHPMPGLSPTKKAPGNNGFRRGGGRRRDSLSDSDGEDSRM